MRPFCRILITLCTVQYHYFLEYRAELILWMLAGILPFIMMGVWSQASAFGEFPLSSLEFARYFITVFGVRQSTVVWVIYELEIDIVEGKLSPKLLHPIDPIWHYLTMHIGEQWARLPFSGLIVIIFFFLYPGAVWTPRILDSVVFVFSLISAFLIRFMAQYTIATLGFWHEKISYADQPFTLCYIFLSGIIAPLSLYPDQIRRFLCWTPFPCMVDVPASILLGKGENVLGDCIICWLWIGGLWIVNREIWRKGIKKYSAMGA